MFSLLIAELKKRGARPLLLLLGAVVVSAAFCLSVSAAVANRPRLVLREEPTGNLDSVSGEGIMRLLRRLNEEQGVTVVLVTHDERIASYADRAVELHDGKLVE